MLRGVQNQNRNLVLATLIRVQSHPVVKQPMFAEHIMQLWNQENFGRNGEGGKNRGEKTRRGRTINQRQASLNNGKKYMRSGVNIDIVCKDDTADQIKSKGFA